jgi:methylthioribose-1-phosphate isomerase
VKVKGKHYRSIWFDRNSGEVKIIDQRWLPHDFRIAVLDSLDDFAVAIRDMWVRGAPLIGATAAYGMACEIARNAGEASLDRIWEVLHQTRPTAINLRWALDRCRDAVRPLPESERAAAAMALAHEIAEEDVEINRAIGMHGLDLIRGIADKKKPGEPVRILTHCNAGWLATVDWGTATSPMYHARDAAIPIHIWVDETRPRNQGALTAWELGSAGIPHTYITDNAGGHLMQHDLVDMVIVGTDRTTAQGDVCNKIGTYLKALAAKDNGVPFYVGLPSPTIDWTVRDGLGEIPIEDRPGREVTHVFGRNGAAEIGEIQVSPDGTDGGNPAFDVTPAHLISGLITERGVVSATAGGLAEMFPDKTNSS